MSKMFDLRTVIRMEPTAGTSVILPSTSAVLRDGSSVEFVTMQPTDAERLVRFHHTLSAESTYLRFFSYHPELLPSELDRFTHVDHREREAVVAVARDEIVGVARFDRLPGSTDAEVAFVVTDAWQGRGLGSALFRRLAARAREVGIERFVAQTLAQNVAMLAVFRHAGLHVTNRRDHEIIHLVIDLSAGATAEVCT
jgi:RimJ/RimL family protein N-acetyltransferase